jgi:CheY-like chemotaxis protein
MGKGTGLGLATVHGVVHQNNGFIQTESQPGVGTTFRLHFPRSLEPTETESEPVLSGSTDGCGETILVVEDEPAILKLACALLERSGYTVLPALTPAEALDLGMQHPHPIRLLVTDVIMPQMNGRDLARHITRHHPTIRCLFMSGYTADVIAHHGVLEAGVHFIQKPFTPADLAAAVRRALDAPLVS